MNVGDAMCGTVLTERGTRLERTSIWPLSVEDKNSETLLTVEAGATTLFRASNIEGRNALIGIAIPLLVNLHAGIRVGRKINQMGHGRPFRCHTGHIGLRKDLAFNFLKVGIELTDQCHLEHLDHGMVEVVWDAPDRIL